MLALAAAVAPAAAQQPASQQAYCDRLRADMAALDRAGPPGGQRQQIAEQMQRQRAEVNRTVAYARSIGCQRQRFLFFGEGPPPECPSLEAKINSLEAGLAQLDAQLQRAGGGGEAQRASLAAAYDANCRGVAPGQAANRQPGLFEQLFGSPGEEVPPMQEDGQPAPAAPEGPPGVAAAGKTLCVRKCDGFYFPISQYASRVRFELDASLCQASCPNAEVELFVQPAGREANEAVSLAGTPYTSLPNAFRYRKTFDSSCTCRKDGQSWQQALAEAEKLIGGRAGDVTVTEQQSQEMARPQAAPAPGQKPATKGKQSAPRAAAPTADASGGMAVDPSTLNPGAATPSAPSQRRPSAPAGGAGIRSEPLPPMAPPVVVPPAGVPRSLQSQ
ncbi:hypothetical protein SLNSH_07045 [Alsobacter soli]|uniref:DUF2865 domain-containing protein n=2 Tax=Alsobacter soli TaxID=2109933 RepID=A0A2T1HW56_9HYPH|nr:hypothetical protein SLNSH_07045 [Alsobacter soli]